MRNNKDVGLPATSLFINLFTGNKKCPGTTRAE